MIVFINITKVWKVLRNVSNWKTIFVILPQLETFLSTFHSLVLLVKTIITFSYIFFVNW